MTPVITFRKLVMPRDLNPANRLFGGQMCSWIDEAAALFVICKTGNSNNVTLKISELIFKQPVMSGDFLSFEACVVDKGKTSLTVDIKVFKKEFPGPELFGQTLVCECSMVFVTIDPLTGKSIPHGL
jgi:acyl-CoA hydrolase